MFCWLKVCRFMGCWGFQGLEVKGLGLGVGLRLDDDIPRNRKNHKELVWSPRISY